MQWTVATLSNQYITVILEVVKLNLDLNLEAFKRNYLCDAIPLEKHAGSSVMHLSVAGKWKLVRIKGKMNTAKNNG